MAKEDRALIWFEHKVSVLGRFSLLLIQEDRALMWFDNLEILTHL